MATTHPPGSPKLPDLSDREREIADLMVRGLSDRQIASSLFVTEGTVKNHITAIYRKLGTSNRARAIMRLRQRG